MAGAKRRGAQHAKRRPEADRALVLRRFPYGESSLVVHLLTRQHGRLSLLAKGAYRLKSGFFGVLDLFDTLAVSWRGHGRGPHGRARASAAAIATPAGGLAPLADASIVTRRRGPTRELARYRAALAVLELAGVGALEGQGDPALFDLVEGTLDRIGDPGTSPELELLVFDLRFLELAGLAPVLAGCAACGRTGAEAPEGTAGTGVPFSLAAGGRLCSACANEALRSGARSGGVRMLPLPPLRIARSLLLAPPHALARTRLAPEALAGVRALVSDFLEHHLETRLRTRGIRGRRGRLNRRRPSSAPRTLSP